MAVSPLGSTGRPVATPFLGSVALWVWGPWPMTLSDGPILWNLGGSSHASPSPSARLVLVETGQMVITKVCCLCSLEGQPLRLVLHCGLVSWPKSSFFFFPWYKKTQMNFPANPIPEHVCDAGVWHQTTETRALPVRWHQTAGTKVPQVLVGPGACTWGLWWEWQLGSLWIPFGDHSSLPWRVVLGFWSDPY